MMIIRDTGLDFIDFMNLYHIEIDAGLAAVDPEGSVRVTRTEWLEADQEQVNSFRTLELYSNQFYLVENDRVSGDTVLKWKYTNPTITDLEEIKK